MTATKNAATETKRGPGRPAGSTQKKRSPAQIIADVANKMIRINQRSIEAIKKTM